MIYILVTQLYNSIIMIMMSCSIKSTDIITRPPYAILVKRLSLHISQVAHQAGAYPGLRSMNQLLFLHLPPHSGWDDSPGTAVIPCIKSAGAHLCTSVKIDTARVKYLTQEHNTMSQDRIWTRTARTESSTLSFLKNSNTHAIHMLIIKVNQTCTLCRNTEYSEF